MNKKSVKLIMEPATREEWRLRRYAEEYGSPSEHHVVLSVGETRIDIFGGTTGYDTGGVTRIKVNGKTIWDEGDNYQERWNEYWKENQDKKSNYDEEYEDD